MSPLFEIYADSLFIFANDCLFSYYNQLRKFMNKYLFSFFPLFITAILSLTGCSNNIAKIEGTFSDNTNDEKRVYLQSIDIKDAQKVNVLDSATVKNGKFELKAEVTDWPAMGFVSVGKMEELMSGVHENPVMASFVIEPGTTKIAFEKSTYTLAGTPKNEEMNKVVSVMNKANKMQQEVMAVGGSVSAVPHDENGQDIMTRMQNLSKEMQNETYAFLKSNMNNKAGEFMFMTSGNSLSGEQLKELLALADSSFIKMPEIAELIQALNNEVSSMDEITLVDISGKEVKLSDYIGKGKYVLVDFWATWCGPCMQEVPNLKKVYEQYKNKGFEIVGISLDHEQNVWKKVIGEKGMSWTHLYDIDKKAATFYSVSSIPFTILFDKEGNIIDANLRGSKLEEKLKELIK